MTGRGAPRPDRTPSAGVAADLSGPALLAVRDLTVRYPGGSRPAVHRLSFDLRAGESLAIVGESGSGKSTAALAITRLADRSVGVEAASVTFEGRSLQALRPRELRRYRGRRIGMVFQDPAGSWNPARTIGAQLMDGLRATGSGSAGRDRLVALLERVGITGAEDRLLDYPHQFSGGMLQRAMIAGALATGPSLLIADEPTSALDTTVQAELLALLAEMRAETGFSLIMISHDLGVVARVADRTLVLYAGETVEHGPTRLLFDRPAHPYTWGLLAAIPRLGMPRKTRLATVRSGPVADRGCRFAPRCPLAVPRCEAETPLIRPVGGRDVACHRAEDVGAELGQAVGA